MVRQRDSVTCCAVACIAVLIPGCADTGGDRAAPTLTRDTVTVEAAPEPHEQVEFALRHFYSRLSDPNPDVLLVDSVCPAYQGNWVDILRDENIRVTSQVAVDLTGSSATARYDAIVYKFGRTEGAFRYTTTFVDDAGTWQWCGQQRNRTGS